MSIVTDRHHPYLMILRNCVHFLFTAGGARKRVRPSKIAALTANAKEMRLHKAEVPGTTTKKLGIYISTKMVAEADPHRQIHRGFRRINEQTALYF